MAGSRYFDGTGYYSESANGTDYQGLSGFTISAWVYRPTSGIATIPYGITNSGSNVISLYWWSDNKIYMDVRNGSTKYRNSAANTSTGWYHIAGVFDGTASDTSRMKVFLNCVDVTTEGTTGNPTTTGSNFAVTGRVGRLDVSPANTANNTRLAHVAIFNVALTLRELCELMAKPNSPQRGRLHYWPLMGNETTSNHSEPDQQRIHNLTGTSMPASSPSTMSPPVCVGGSALWL